MKQYQMMHKAFPPKTKIKIKSERLEVIEDYLEGNLLRFLRRLDKMAHFQLVYSKYIIPWEKTNPDINKTLFKYYDWPIHIVNLVNIMRVMSKHYGRPFSKESAKIALIIDDLFDEDIYNYRKEHRQKKVNQFGLDLNIYLPTHKEALKEHKARGFIHPNEYEDYNPKFAHAFSNIDRNLVYPHNFISSTSGRLNDGSDIEAHIGLSLVGIRGYTRIEIPYKP